MNTSPPAILSPQEWCRHALAAVAQRKLNVQEAGYLEMLLVYCIECDPSAEAFPPLLARFVADPRPGIAAAAGLLQDAWQRIWAEDVSAPPPMQEALRTLGGLLDDAEAQAAYIAISPEGVQVQQRDSSGALTARVLNTVTLQQELAARTALRGQVPAVDPTNPERYEPRLRALGAELDTEPPQSYQVLVTRQTIVVAGSAGYDRTFSGAELQARLAALLDRRQDGDEVHCPDDQAVPVV